jgi:hypothetical protein
LDLKIELFKLIAFERLAKFLTSVFTVIVIIFVLFFVMLFLSLAFVHWFQETGGSEMHGYLIVALFYSIVGIVIFLASKRLFLNPMVKGFSETAFEAEDDLLNSGNNEMKKNGKN